MERYFSSAWAVRALLPAAGFFADFFLSAIPACSLGNIVATGRFRSGFHGKSDMATKKKTKAKSKTKTNHRAATAHGHHRPANSNEPSLSARPIWQGSLRLSL